MNVHLKNIFSFSDYSFQIIFISGAKFYIAVTLQKLALYKYDWLIDWIHCVKYEINLYSCLNFQFVSYA